VSLLILVAECALVLAAAPRGDQVTNGIFFRGSMPKARKITDLTGADLAVERGWEEHPIARGKARDRPEQGSSWRRHRLGAFQPALPSSSSGRMGTEVRDQRAETDSPTQAVEIHGGL